MERNPSDVADGKHELAELARARERLVGGGGVVERPRRGDRDLERTFGKRRQESVGDLSGQRCLLVGRARAQRRSTEGCS